MESNTTMVSNSKNDNQKKRIESFFNSGGLWFSLPLIAYFFSSMYERLTLDALNVPKDFAKTNYFSILNFYEKFLLILPLVFIVYAIYSFVSKWISVFKGEKEDDSANLTSFNPKVYKSEAWIVGIGGIFLFASGILFLLAAPYYYIVYLPALYMAVLAIIISISNIRVLRSNSQSPSSEKFKGYLPEEKLLRRLTIYIFLSVFMPLITILCIFHYKQHQPVEFMIEVGENNEQTALETENFGSNTYYTLKYLIHEKDGIGVFGNMLISISDIEDENTYCSSSEREYEIFLSDKFEVKEITKHLLKPVSFKSELVPTWLSERKLETQLKLTNYGWANGDNLSIEYDKDFKDSQSIKQLPIKNLCESTISGQPKK